MAPHSDPWPVVEAQLRAYEAGDLDAFVGCFAPDATVAELGSGEVICAGRDAIREEYAGVFEAPSDLDVDVLDRVGVAEYVAVGERIRGLTDAPVGVLAVYRVADGAIRELHLAYPD